MTLSEFANSIAMQWGLENNFATIERIKLHAISGRAVTIQRRYDQTKIFPQSLIVSLRCQEVIEVSEDECDCFEGCGTIFRSENKVPRPLIVKDDSYFMFVGKGAISYSALKPEEVQDVKNRKFSSRENFYYYANDYIYFINPTDEFIARYVPENPLELFGLGCKVDCVEDGELQLEPSLEEGIFAFLKDKRPLIIEEVRNQVTIDGDN